MVMEEQEEKGRKRERGRKGGYAKFVVKYVGCCGHQVQKQGSTGIKEALTFIFKLAV